LIIDFIKEEIEISVFKKRERLEFKFYGVEKNFFRPSKCLNINIRI